MNVYDGNRLRNAMNSLGWREVEDALDSDVAIFVTCSIRDKAEQKVVSELGRFRPQWERHGRPSVALVGCMAQRVGESVARGFPWVKVVAGPRMLGAVPDSITASADDGKIRIILSEDRGKMEDLHDIPLPRVNPHKAYVTIANGCDQFCSYCIVPYVRGKFKSREPDDILNEINRLASAGTVEITLLGQNVNSYGKDFEDGLEGYRFAPLLSDAASITGLKRLRFTTSHPIDFGADILDVMSSNRTGNICPSINLPAQSGSDKVLLEMNRKYTREEYLRVVGMIRAAFPSAGLTTDLIVGFPGETGDEFLDSLSLLEEVRFDLVHSAAFSPREGTPAAARTDQVPAAERARRLTVINDVQSGISKEINRSMEGLVCDVLLDEPAPRGEGLLQGRTVTDKVVLVRAPSEMTGEIRSVRILGSTAWHLEGELV
jgi:tRNA-2-methylthio-N6-dimethylallyladenosine synthase